MSINVCNIHSVFLVFGIGKVSGAAATHFSAFIIFEERGNIKELFRVNDKYNQLIFFLLFQLHKRIESLQQQNRVLKCELETYKLRVKSLQEVKTIQDFGNFSSTSK